MSLPIPGNLFSIHIARHPGITGRQREHQGCLSDGDRLLQQAPSRALPSAAIHPAREMITDESSTKQARDGPCRQEGRTDPWTPTSDDPMERGGAINPRCRHEREQFHSSRGSGDTLETTPLSPPTRGGSVHDRFKRPGTSDRTHSRSIEGRGASTERRARVVALGMGMWAGQRFPVSSRRTAPLALVPPAPSLNRWESQGPRPDRAYSTSRGYLEHKAPVFPRESLRVASLCAGSPAASRPRPQSPGYQGIRDDAAIEGLGERLNRRSGHRQRLVTRCRGGASPAHL